MAIYRCLTCKTKVNAEEFEIEEWKMRHFKISDICGKNNKVEEIPEQ